MTMLLIRAVTTVDASDLGLKPGEWPASVKYEGWTWTCPEFKTQNGELLHVSYFCRGRRLVVVND